MEEKVLKRLFEHAVIVDDRLEGGKRLFTGLVGSQNYGLSTEKSDVDSISVIVPSFKNLILPRERTSKTISMDRGEFAQIKDFRDYCHLITKGSMNIFEALFSPYIDISEEFFSYYEKLVNMREDIAYANPIAVVNSYNGQIVSDLRHAFNEVTDYFNSKKIADAERLLIQLISYVEGMPFEEILDVSDYRDFVLEIKAGEYDFNQAIRYRDSIIAESDKAMARFQQNYHGDYKMNPVVKNELDNLILQIFEECY